VEVPGETVIAAVAAPPGDHEYVPPEAEGVAVRVADCDAHIVEVAGLIETVGTGLTVSVPVPVFEHPDKV
jgi:hypothetical protein